MDPEQPEQPQKQTKKEEYTQESQKQEPDAEGKKEPETLSEGERMGLSKQQMRKL